MKTTSSLLTVLTADQLAKSKKGCMVYMDNLAQCKKVVALGFTLEQASGTKIAKYRMLQWKDSRALSDLLNAHGVAVKVVSVQDKYSDNNGAYEVMTLADADGNEFTVSNCYDSSACFRHMDNDARIAYANING